MRNVGIPVIVDDGWMGGTNYFLSLLDALDEQDCGEWQINLLTNRSDLFSRNYRPHIKIRQCDLLSNASAQVRTLSRHFATDIRLAYYAKHYSLDLLTHAIPGSRFMPPTLFWMPDFQHCHLPHLFSAAELKARDMNITFAAERSLHLLLSSQSAEADFRHFYPQYQKVTTHVLPFVPYIREQDFNCHEQWLVNSSTEAPYFFLPNQFWVHKNHRIVIEALALLPDDVRVICTGSLSDYRNTDHIQELQQRIGELGLEQRFIILGLVERKRMMELLANAVAVINPSLFEGWSTTVEEAKYMGKRIILSDLPVHREQNPELGIYFEPHNPECLAEKMREVWFSKLEDSVTLNRFHFAKSTYFIKRKEFALKYIDVISQFNLRGD